MTMFASIRSLDIRALRYSEHGEHIVMYNSPPLDPTPQDEVDHEACRPLVVAIAKCFSFHSAKPRHDVHAIADK